MKVLTLVESKANAWAIHISVADDVAVRGLGGDGEDRVNQERQGK